jgi:hypothetical protein
MQNHAQEIENLEKMLSETESMKKKQFAYILKTIAINKNLCKRILVEGDYPGDVPFFDQTAKFEHQKHYPKKGYFLYSRQGDSKYVRAYYIPATKKFIEVMITHQVSLAANPISHHSGRFVDAHRYTQYSFNGEVKRKDAFSVINVNCALITLRDKLAAKYNTKK